MQIKVFRGLLVSIFIIILFEFFFFLFKPFITHYVYSPLINFIRKSLNNNVFFIAPIDVILYCILFQSIYIIIIIVILWKLKFNLRTLTKIELKKTIIFIISIYSFYLICFLVLPNFIFNISNSWFKINNHFNTFQQKYIFFWSQIGYVMLEFFSCAVFEELIHRVFYIFITYKFSKSLLGAIVISNLFFVLFHFYGFSLHYPFIISVSKNSNILSSYLIYTFFSGSLILMLILTNNLLVPIFSHFFYNNLLEILSNKFKPLIECTMSIIDGPKHILGIQLSDFITLIAHFLLFIILLIIFFKKRNIT